MPDHRLIHHSLVAAALALLLPGFLQAQNVDTAGARCVPPRGVRLWSTAQAWPGGVLPGPNTEVVIPAGDAVWLDLDGLQNGVTVKSITVEGELTVACGGGEIRANYVLVDGGRFTIGTSARPYPFRVELVLTHDPAHTNYGSPTSAGDMLDQALIAQNGAVVEMHGRDFGKSWVQLDQTANAGDTQIQLTEAVGWRRGQEIVLASTDFDLDQAEVATIERVDGALVTLMNPLQHMHWGQIEGPYANGMSVDERGEVGLLSRSITVRGTPFTAPDGRTMGGHTMIHRGPGGITAATPRMETSWVEFRELGREGTIGRYPLHAHRAQSLQGTHFHACSITQSFNRVVSVHDVLDVTVTDCVAHEHIGHGFYFEGPGASLNVMTGNLGLGTRAAQPGREVIPSDNEPGTYWLENPNNEITDNVAAGSEHFGFWWEGPFNATISPRFDRNVAHSNGSIGIYQDTRPRTSAGLIQDLTLYKNREHALWWRTYGRMTFRGIAIADSRAGTYLASEGVQHSEDFSFITLEDSLIVGETSNVGEITWDIERAHGRSLPQPGDRPFRHGFLGAEWDALIGVEMYDGGARIANTHFVNFDDANITCLPPACAIPATFRRKAGAIGQVDYHNPWSFLPTNSVANLTFENADEVWMRTPVGAPLGDNGIANTVLIDEDGSLTGTPMTYVRPINSFLTHQPQADTDFRAEWNAHTMEMIQPDGLGGSDVAYRYGLFQWQHALANAPLLNSTLIERIPLDLTLSPQSFDIDNATCNQNPYTLFPSALVPGAIYRLSNPGLQASDWPTDFHVRWSGTAPGDFIVLTVPYPAQTVTVRFDGVISSTAIQGYQGLLTASSNAYSLDQANSLLHLKLFVGGSGPTVWDGRLLDVLVTE